MRKSSSHALVLFCLAIPLRALADGAGVPEILTGDTIKLAATAYRLQGIDAPEPGQTCYIERRKYDCGKVSKTALMDLTAGFKVRCVPNPPPPGGGLPTARCFAGGYDLSQGMVHTGWALADPLTGSIYRAIGREARKAGRGLWRGRFVTPWEWRAGKRFQPAPTGN